MRFTAKEEAYIKKHSEAIDAIDCAQDLYDFLYDEYNYSDLNELKDKDNRSGSGEQVRMITAMWYKLKGASGFVLWIAPNNDYTNFYLIPVDEGDKNCREAVIADTDWFWDIWADAGMRIPNDRIKKEPKDKEEYRKIVIDTLLDSDNIKGMDNITGGMEEEFKDILKNCNIQTKAETEALWDKE